MLPKFLSFFLKTFHLQRKSGASKIKSATEYLTSMVYESFILGLLISVLASHSYCGIKKNLIEFSKQQLNLSLFL